MKKSNARTYTLLLTACALVAAGLACGKEDEAAPTATPEVRVVTATPSGGSTTTDPTSTPVPGGCADGMEFVADVSIPDGTVFDPGVSFIKTWRLRNAGTCDWSGYLLVFLDGEPMGTQQQAIPDMPVGETFDISIEMTAPGGAGDYSGRWRVQSDAGANLGTVTCVITVRGEEPTDEPTEEPVDEPTEEAAPGAPAAPSNLHLGGWSMTTFTLAWDDNSDDETGFRVRHVGVGWLDPVAANVTELELPYPPCGETYQYRVRAFSDAGDSDPSNTLDVEGTVCPDLVVQDLVLDPNPVNPGMSLGATWTVVNQGTGQAGPSLAQLRLAGHGEIWACNVPALNPGQSHDCELSAGVAMAPAQTGNYAARVKADDRGAVAESDEDNNVAELTLQIRN